MIPNYVPECHETQTRINLGCDRVLVLSGPNRLICRYTDNYEKPAEMIDHKYIEDKDLVDQIDLEIALFDAKIRHLTRKI